MIIEPGTRIVGDDGRTIAVCKGIESHSEPSLVDQFEGWTVAQPQKGETLPEDADEWHITIPMYREPILNAATGKIVMPYHQFVRLETGWFPEDPTHSAAFDLRHKWRGTDYEFRSF